METEGKGTSVIGKQGWKQCGNGVGGRPGCNLEEGTDASLMITFLWYWFTFIFSFPNQNEFVDWF